MFTQGFKLPLLLSYFILLGVVAATTPISPSEAYHFYHTPLMLSTRMMHLGQMFLSGEIGLRLPFLILGIVNAYLFYRVSLVVLEKPKDAWFALGIYLLLPGVLTSTILASNALMMTTAVLLFLYAYVLDHKKVSVVPLGLLLYLHWSAAFVYLILFVYALFRKDKYLLFAAIILLLAYLFLGLEIPEESTKNYFFTLIGTYAAIFSPLVFIYFIYALYRTLFRGKRDIVWYLAFLTLGFSLLFSLGERVGIVDFSPYLMLGIIVAVRTYYHSLRVRLKQFRQGYKLICRIVIVSLGINALFLLTHQPIYRLLGKSYYPIVAPVYAPYDRAKVLLKHEINCIDDTNRRDMDQMRYYGLKGCS